MGFEILVNGPIEEVDTSARYIRDKKILCKLYNNILYNVQLYLNFYLKNILPLHCYWILSMHRKISISQLIINALFIKNW